MLTLRAHPAPHIPPGEPLLRWASSSQTSFQRSTMTSISSFSMWWSPTHDFFSLPLELRLQVYTEVWAPKLKLHLFLKDGRPSFSPCVGANLGDEGYDSRGPTEAEYAQLVKGRLPWGCGSYGVSSDGPRRCIQRLQSSWGPHYRCEEVAKGMRICSDLPAVERHSCVSMLLVCKQM